jgi:L-amino acid N-acyltransferase YncA
VVAAVEIKIIPLEEKHFKTVSEIYLEGLQTRIASFETKIPSWAEWNKKFLKECRFVATVNNIIAGWCALSAVSNRQVYSGVAEDTVYVSENFRQRYIGTKLLSHLISESERAGYWTLQASIFPENRASIRLHERSGFRIIGTREKIAKRDGKWHDNVIMERRSKLIQ